MAMSILIGFLFTIMGSLLTVVDLIAISQGAPLVFLLGLIISISATIIGFLTITSFAHYVNFSDEGIKMIFTFKEDQILWEQVEWFKYFAVRGKFDGGANIYTLLKYRKSSGDVVCFSKAALLLPSNEKVSSFSPKDYTTILDKFVSEKNKANKGYHAN